MADQFVKTKLDDLAKRYRLQPIGTKKFVDTYWNTLKAAGYDIRDRSQRSSSGRHPYGSPVRRKGIFGRL